MPGRFICFLLRLAYRIYEGVDRLFNHRLEWWTDGYFWLCDRIQKQYPDACMQCGIRPEEHVPLSWEEDN